MEESKLATLVSALELELHPPHVSYLGVDFVQRHHEMHRDNPRR